MDSTDLRAHGFIEWHQFARIAETALLSKVPSSFGVYALRRTRRFGRFVGDSDIAYIGSAASPKGLRGRIMQYFHPGPSQSTNRRILSLLGRLGDVQLSFVPTNSQQEATSLERSLLADYESDHAELPPLNRRQ
jgi:excinuclease UvrABC nuclease subunit